MKRLVSFLILILLLAFAVGSLQMWHDRQDGRLDLQNSLSDFFSRGFSGVQRRPEKYTVAEGPRVNINDVDVLAAMSRQRILLTKAVIPSVVSVITEKTVSVPAYMNDPMFQFFHRGREGAMGGTQHALGSGVIVSKEGHILTNNHVIDQMDAIKVKLSDGRIKEARLIGADSDTDVAVLKIDADNLTPLPFGDSDKVEVGESVLAVGNPYGLDESVTQGIISAKGRHGSENISDLFQTDAAINPGNSGGPLINVQGELIGLNEAIFSQSGGSQGVGFAIPAATVRRTMDSILKTGRVVYGYLGVRESKNADDSDSDSGQQENGARVDDVVAGSPAEKANIRPGDLIQKFNNKPVGSFRDLRQCVSQVDIDATVPIELLRDGKKVTVQARVGEKPPPEAQLSQLGRQRQGQLNQPPAPANPAPNAGDDSILGGVSVIEISPAVIRRLGVPRDVTGVVVSRVDEDAAASSVLQSGDIIEQINQQPVGSMSDYKAIVRQLPADQPAILSVVRDRARQMVVINPG
jgi:serine protease Do